MRMYVGTSPVQFPAKGNTRPMVQNLGPGNVYFDNRPDVSVESGIMMPVGTVYEFPADLQRGSGFIWVIADESGTDLRYITVG